MNEFYIKYTILFLIVISIIISALLVYIFIKYRSLLKLFGNKNAQKNLLSLMNDIQDISQENKKIKELLNNLSEQQKDSISKVGLVKFNPFAGSGDSRLSYCFALLSENGNGIVVTFLYVRGGISLYAKEVENFKVKNPTEEEQKAIERAKNSVIQ